MKRIYCLLIVLSSLCCIADEPRWLNAEQRELLYRSSEYYTGFAVTDMRAGENIEDAYNRARSQARAELVSSIRMSVHVETNTEMLNRVYGADNVQTLETFHSTSRQTAGASNIPGINVEVYSDAKAKTVCAFAYIQKKDLARKLEKQLIAALSKIEIVLDEAKQRTAEGNKGEAKKKLASLEEQYAVVEETQCTMLAVDATLGKEDIAADEYVALRKQVSALYQELNDGYAIFIQCQATLFDANFLALLKGVKGDLSKAGCHFVDEPDMADWVVMINAYTEEYNVATFGNVTNYTVNAMADVTIDRQSTGKRVYEEELVQKGVHTMNDKEAGKEAYKKLITQISQTIIQQFN